MIRLTSKELLYGAGINKKKKKSERRHLHFLFLHKRHDVIADVKNDVSHVTETKTSLLLFDGGKSQTRKLIGK